MNWDKLQDEIHKMCSNCDKEYAKSGTRYMWAGANSCDKCKDLMRRLNMSDIEMFNEIIDYLILLIASEHSTPPTVKAFKLHRIYVLLGDLAKDYGISDTGWNGVNLKMFYIDLNDISEYTFEDYLADDRAFWRRIYKRLEKEKK